MDHPIYPPKALPAPSYRYPHLLGVRRVRANNQHFRTEPLQLPHRADPPRHRILGERHRQIFVPP